MSSNFFNNSTYPIGLDISDLSIKLVQLKKNKGKIKIQALGKISINEGIINNGEIINNDKAVEVIKKLINNLKFGKVTSDEAVVSLPETKTFIKLIKINKTANQISEIINHEIEKNIPMSIDEIYYDWQVIEEHQDHQLILISAAPRNMVDQYMSLLKDAGLSVVAMETEPISLCRSLLNEELPDFEGKKNYGIIDIGARRTSMTIYSKNTIAFTMSVPISGEKITNTIMNALEIKKSYAEKAKIFCGLDKGKAQGIVKGILDEVNRITHLFYRHIDTRTLYDMLSNGLNDIKELYTALLEVIEEDEK